MTPQTLNCPMCGAPARTDATHCLHCRARLATVACSACFGMVFHGAKFCSHCGASVARTSAPPTGHHCPKCSIDLHAVQVGTTSLQECGKCDGVWVRTACLERICVDRDQQAVVLGAARWVEAGENKLGPIRYVPCPVCRVLMNRVNFANCSGVIVDVCKAHGTWFDRDELRRIIEFIRAGGLDKARTRRIAELAEQERRLKRAQTGSRFDSSSDHSTTASAWDFVDFGGGLFDVLGSAGSLLDLLDL